MLEYKEGNIWDSDVDLICNVVSCDGRFDDLFSIEAETVNPEITKTAKSIYNQWIVEERGNEIALSGRIHIVKDTYPYLCLLFVSEQPQIASNAGLSRLEGALSSLYSWAMAVNKLTGFVPKIAIPYGIGSDVIGANWVSVREIIQNVFYDYPGAIEIWKK